MRFALAALALLLLVGTGAAQGPAAGPATDEVIAQRREGLKRMNGHLEAMKPIADARGDPRPTLPRLDDMIEFYTGFVARFPPGSDRGDTKARPTVWTERAGFETANANLLRHLGELRATVVAGDAAGFSNSFGTVGRESCGGCHRNYRQR